MGSWQLEVGKMFVYVLFPVATFHIYNHPGIFEEWIIGPHLNEMAVTQVSLEQRDQFLKQMNELKLRKLKGINENVNNYRDISNS